MRRVAEPNRAHSRPRHISAVPPTHTEPTHACSGILRNHHRRDCLYNIGNSVSCDPLHACKVLITSKTCNTEHKYINFGLFEGATWSEHNSNSMGRGAFSSHPRYHLPKKEPLSPPRTRHCRVPHPQSTPEQTREKTSIIRSRMKLRLSMFIKPSFQQRSRSTKHICAARTTHVCSTSSATKPARRSVPHADVAMGWAEGNRSLTPVRVPYHASVPTIPHLVGELPTSLQIRPRVIVFLGARAHHELQ